MESPSKKKYFMKVFPKGQVVIPVNLRKNYHIEIGDEIEISPTPEGILLKSATIKTRGHSKTDRLFGIFKDQSVGKDLVSEQTIDAITERSFADGWKK